MCSSCFGKEIWAGTILGLLISWIWWFTVRDLSSHSAAATQKTAEDQDFGDEQRRNSEILSYINYSIVD